MTARGIVLCADDYGIAPGVDRAIRELVGRARLSAVSCMTLWPEFAREAAELAPLSSRIDLGLHFTLTAEHPLRRVMRDAFLGRLDTDAVRRALQSQLDRFILAFARPPDFIDGHQHVHLLPGVREPVLAAAADCGAYLRQTVEPLSAIRRGGVAPVKAGFLSLLGRPLRRAAARRGIAGNRSFRGVRSFVESRPYRALFRRMIIGAPAGTLVMCHPGLPDATLAARDSLVAPREEEYRYLTSDEFPADLAEAGLRLSRLSEI